MSLLDLVLNLAGLLLFLNWRAIDFVPAVSTQSLLGTLRRAEARRGRRWIHLAALAVLLLARGLFYWQVGPAVDWTPKLNLAVVSLPFRSDFLGRSLLFSLLSFGKTLGAFYLWLLFLSLVNRATPDTDPAQRLVRAHLGWLERWPAYAKLVLAVAAAALVWTLTSALFRKLELLPPLQSTAHGWQQIALMAVAPFLCWKILLAGLLLLHLLNSYVYLGRSAFWDFVNLTACHLLAALRWLPLRLGRVDLAPVTGIALVWFGAEIATRVLTQLYLRLPI